MEADEGAGGVEREILNERIGADELGDLIAVTELDELAGTSPLLRYSAILFHCPQFCVGLPGHSIAQN